MVKRACVDKNGLIKGAWSAEEDNILRAHIDKHGHQNWRLLPKHAGLARCGKSCRLRWVNYLKPGVRRGNFTEAEVALIIQLHQQFGNKWSLIAERLPERTDNDIKNYWHAHIKKHVVNYHSTTPTATTTLSRRDQFSTEHTNGASMNVTTLSKNSSCDEKSEDSGTFSPSAEVNIGIKCDVHASSLDSFSETQPSLWKWNDPFPFDIKPSTEKQLQGRDLSILQNALDLVVAGDPQSVMMQQSYWSDHHVAFSTGHDSFQSGISDMLHFEDDGFSYPSLWDIDSMSLF